VDETTELSRRDDVTTKQKRVRSAIVIASDLLIWPLSLSLAYTFYGRGPINPPSILLISVAMATQLAVGYATWLYRGRFRRFSFDEAGAVAVTAGATGATVIAVEFVSANDGRAGQIIVLATSVAVCLMFGHRYLRRIRAERSKAAAKAHLTPIVVYGAGEGGYRAIAAMQTVRLRRPRPRTTPATMELRAPENPAATA
jgi:FlaA1/EpsC-like NDP-sugar epimerase